MDVNQRALSSMWKTNYRSNNFTTKFMGNMYEDTTMEKVQQREVVIERIKTKMAKVERNRQDLKYEATKKKRILTLYKKKWNVKVKNIDMTVEKLENLLSAKANKKSQRIAVIKIQTSVRRFLAQTKFKAWIKRRLESA
jgi:hypothetical protein